MFCLPFLGPLHDGASLKDDPMHFWIDKRSQGCGFNGRQRVPASLSSGRRRRHSKPMVTPVHRFQHPIPNRPGLPCRRPPSSQESRSNSQQYMTPSISYGASRQPELDSAIYIDGPLESHIELPHTSNTVGPSRLKYWMMALFSLLMVSLTAVKFYYSVEHGFQGNKVDISIASSMTLLAAGLMVSCLLSGCRNKGTSTDFLTTPSTPQHQVAGTDVEVAGVSGRDEVLLVLHNPVPTTASPPVQPEQEQPPPPYHLAILLPPRETVMDESPPPAYDKAVLR